jgi:hypothetical protein
MGGSSEAVLTAEIRFWALMLASLCNEVAVPAAQTLEALGEIYCQHVLTISQSRHDNGRKSS